MKRNEFLAAAATIGACVCSGNLAFAQNTQSQSTASENPEAKNLKRKIDFMQTRMAKMLLALDETTRKKVLETMGRECAKEFSHLTERFKGKPHEFLEEVRRKWAETASYSESSGTIRVVDRATHCTCAFVQPGLTPPDFCACTLGWQKETYSTILGEPVDAELESSVLRGGKQCAFKILTRRTAHS